MSEHDPGGESPGASAARELASLQENFSQQQAKITALRELVRQTESAHGKKTASAQEKVRNIAQRLTQYKTKATKSRLSRAASSEIQPDLIATRINEEEDVSLESFNVSSAAYEEQHHVSLPPMPVSRARSETPGTEKFNLLRQQMEQNRLKMAERESHKREMEEKVIELKQKLETTQQTLERSVEYGRSTGDLTMLTPLKLTRYEFNKSTSDLTKLASTGYGSDSNFDMERLKYLEGRVKVLEQELSNKENVSAKDETVKDLEHRILDLEEMLKEKECIIEARTQAVSLMTENLTMKGKNTVDLLEDTKQEMFRMQTNFVQAESNLKAEVDRLQLELDEKNSKISNLEEMNNILETARYDLTVENSTLKQKLEDVQDFSTKISELNKMNQNLQHRITELENQKYEFITDTEAEQAKFGESDDKYRELLERIRELEEELNQKVAPEEGLLEKIRLLEATAQSQSEELESYKQQHAELQENLQEKTVELNVLNANFSVLQEKLKTTGPKPLFPKSAEEEAEVENSKLKQQLDEANKSMIKSKLKIKQLQKQVDSFKKTSAVHEEVVRLTEEVQTLTQRLAEVEEEKGNLQLHLVNYDGSLPDSELEKRIKILETTCQNQTTAIQLLEEQKLDISEDLDTTKHELEAMRDQVKEFDQTEQSGRISCQMSSIEYEEKFEKCVADREELSAQVKKLEEEKLMLQEKLDRYMVENIELLDKIEKLSLEKVSSAESIEIVDGLTPKEKREIESYEAGHAKGSAGDVDEPDRSPMDKEGEGTGSDHHRQPTMQQSEGSDSEENLSASLVKLREESSELMQKIELFTNERREVLEKLDALTLENQVHQDELTQLRADHNELLEKHAALQVTERALNAEVTKVATEREELVKEVEAARLLKVKLEAESSTPSSSQSSPAKAAAIDKNSFEQALRSVDNEVSNYNRNKDKTKKLQISKKLSTDAKNLQKMAHSLLEEYCKNVDECETMRVQIEQLKQRVEGMSTSEVDNREVTELRTQIMEITRAQIEKVEQIDQLKEDLDRRDEMIAELKREIDAARDAEKSSDDEPELLKVELNSRNDEIRDLKKDLENLEIKKAAELGEVQTKLSAANKEIEILKELVAEQKQQLIETYQEHEHELAAQLKKIHDYENEAQKMKDEIHRLTVQAEKDAIAYSERQTQQVHQLTTLIEEQKDEIAHKQETIDTLNGQIIDLYKTMEENSNKIIEKEDELQYLQELLDSKKDEIHMLHEKLAESQRSIEVVQKQLEKALSVPAQPTQDFTALEDKNRELNNKNKELMEKLKKFAANLKKKNLQYQEIEQKFNTTCQELEELKQLSVAGTGPAVDELKEENEELSQKMHHLNNELHKLLQQKYSLESEKQTTQATINALQEQLLSLEAKAREAESKLEQTTSLFAEQQKQLEVVQEDLTSKNVKIEKCKAIIKEKNKEIQRLQEHERKTAHLEDELKMSQSKLEDFHNQTLLLGKLKADKEEVHNSLKTELERNNLLDQQILHSAEKVKKIEVDLELVEEENKRLKEQIAKLEQGISLVEQRRNSLERQKRLLGEKLEETSAEFSRHEDELLHRLASLSQHDEAIEQKLKEKEDELMETAGKLRDTEYQRGLLQSKLSQVESLLASHEEALKRSVDIENENYSLRQEVNNLQAEVKRIIAESEAKIAERNNEIDQLEIDLSNQLTKVENERRRLQEDLERTRDQNTDLQDELVRLQENANSLEQLRSDLDKEVTWLKMQNESLNQDSSELQELRMQIVQDQTELENLRAQSETMVQNHQGEINALRQQIADMEAIRTQLSQNQTDDQVFVQNEMIKLKDQLQQKESIITQLQQQNLQLQMAASGPSALDDPFAGFQRSSERSSAALEEKIRDLENDATLKDSRIQELQIEKNLLEGNMNDLKKQLDMLEKTVLHTEEMESQLLKRSSNLEQKSKTLFQTVVPQQVASHEPHSVPAFSGLQFFTTPANSAAASLFESVASMEEPLMTQSSHAALCAIPEGQEIQVLKSKVEQLTSSNEEASTVIEQLHEQLNLFKERNDEIHQLKDEIDILRSQNASLRYEVDEQTAKLKRISSQLQEEQLKVCQFEEQLSQKGAAPSLETFFTDSPAHVPVTEELVVPKKTYVCTPSATETAEEWSVEEPLMVVTTASSQFRAVSSFFDSPSNISNWSSEGNVVIQQAKESTTNANQELLNLKEQIVKLTTQNEEACRQIQELEVKLKTFINLDDEFHQLKDEIDILRAQNASLREEVDEQCSKLKHVSENLQSEQLKVYELEEQLSRKEVISNPSAASFFTDSSAYIPVVEEKIVPQKTYVCTPSQSDATGLVEEPLFMASTTSSQHAVKFAGAPDNQEVVNLRMRNEQLCLEITRHKEEIQNQNLKLSELTRLVESYQQSSHEVERLKDSIAAMEQQLGEARQALANQQQHYEAQVATVGSQHHHELTALASQHQCELTSLATRHQQEITTLTTQHQQEITTLRDQNQIEHKQHKEELNRLKKQNEDLEQDRDAFIQLQDEIDILKAQNASFQQELQEKSDKIKRISQTLTKTEQQVCSLQEQLDQDKEQPLAAASLFGTTQQGSAAAVFEEIIQPKRRAFQLHPAEQQQQHQQSTLQLDDDCWGVEEAMLEEKHQQSSSAVLERHISEKDDYIRQLELEKERLQQEIIELKVKSGKLLKKLKEYKAKSEELQRRSASMETNELDLAIQEELNAQIKTLENQLSELRTDHEKAVAEKESLLNRVDVLVAANERFTEMKERQDVQLEVQLAKIKELNIKIHQLEEWDNKDDEAISEKKDATKLEATDSADKVQLEQQIIELTKDIQDLRVDNEELQALLEEEKANVVILEKRVQQKDNEIQELIEKLDGLSQDSQAIKSSLETLNQQKTKETAELSQQLREFMNKNTELTQQIEKMRTESLFHSSQQEEELQQKVQQLSAQLQYKEAEIVHLTERIEQQAREDQTESLVHEILVKNQEISTLRAQVQQLESDRQELENNLTLQISKELAAKSTDDKGNPRQVELERVNQELREEKQQMEEELQVLNDQVLRSLELEDHMKQTVLELDAKNIEIEALKSSLELLKTSESSGTNSEESTPASKAGEEDLRAQIKKLLKERSDLENNYRITLEQRDAHWAQVVEERGTQVAESWKQHVDMREAEFSLIEKDLREELERLQNEVLSAEALDQQAAEEPVNLPMVQKMKEALESQELEIVTLKEQLAIRSAEYARLAAQVDPFAVKHASNMVTSEPLPLPVDNDRVPRSELEFALYMSYQREMRCEELELELRNLLEERDALQLRLSNALRQHEEFKRKLLPHIGEPSGESSDISKTTTPEKSLQQIVQESGISAAATTPGESDLTTKLTELHSIGQTKEKRLQEEREERYRQLSLIHRDLANMPLEAAAKLAGTNISAPSDSPAQQQQQQSASSVLINWILGKKSDS